MAIDTINYQSDTCIRLNGLKNEKTGLFLSTANPGITAQVQTETGTNIGAAVPLMFKIGTNGNWEGTLPDTLAVQMNQSLIVVVTVDDTAGTGLKRTYIERARVVA